MSCPKCAHDILPGTKFCGRCGYNLSQAAAASESTSPTTVPQGERRQATVLFSDLSGYTAMNERLDPEEVESIMSHIKAEAVGIVDSYGGSVNQFVGDEVLALFGIPTAHKDDPVRAVRAAQELHEMVRRVSPDVETRLGRAIRFHTGIDTGLIVTNRKDDRDGRIGITGDTVNTGARLKALAPDDVIVVSPDTRRWIAAEFQTEALPPASLKGKGAKVTPYRVVGLAGARQGAAHAFVGRGAELRQFQGAVESCLESGHGQSILLRGEPGIGKTRLTDEFQLMAAGLGFAVHMGLVLDFGAGKGRDAIRALIHSLVALQPNAESEERKTAVKTAIEEGLIEAEQEACLNDLLKVPQPEDLRAVYDAMENETRNRRKRETVSRLIAASSGRQPLLLVVEDVHWAESVTLAYLAELAASIAEYPALLVMTTRVQGDPLDQAWRQSVRGVPLMTIDLGPLRPEEAAAMAQAYLEVTEQTAQRCVERAEGNPLFLEQLLLGAEETAETGIPGSVQSIVLARVDHLAQGDKEALQAASVLGQRFGLDALQVLSGQPGYDCAPLVANGLIRPQGSEFLFAHALVREGVYDSILHTHRKALHESAADWFGERDLVLRAEHLDAAEHPKAPNAHLEAARNQFAEFHFELCLRMATRGLGLATDIPVKFALSEIQGRVLRELGLIGRSIEAFREALHLAGDDHAKCRAMIGIGAGLRLSDQYDEAVEILEKADEIAEQCELQLERAEARHLRGNIAFLQADIEACIQAHSSALDFACRAGSSEAEARCEGGLGDAFYVQGRIPTALNHFEKCVRLCKSHGLRRVEVEYSSMAGCMQLFMGNAQRSLDESEQALLAAKEIGHLRAQLVAHRCVWLTALEMADFPNARSHAEAGCELARTLNSRSMEAGALHAIGISCLASADSSDGWPILMEALEISRETGMGLDGPWILGNVAYYAESQDTKDSALEEGLRLLSQGSVAHNHLYFYRQGMLACVQSAHWDRVRELASGLRKYTSVENVPWANLVIATAEAMATGRETPGAAHPVARLKELGREAMHAGLIVFAGEIEQFLHTLSD